MAAPATATVEYQAIRNQRCIALTDIGEEMALGYRPFSMRAGAV